MTTVDSPFGPRYQFDPWQPTVYRTGPDVIETCSCEATFSGASDDASRWRAEHVCPNRPVPLSVQETQP